MSELRMADEHLDLRVAAQELYLALSGDNDVDLIHFHRALVEVIKVLPMLGRLFVPMHKDIADANRQLAALRERNDGQHYHLALGMVEHEVQIDAVHMDGECGVALLNTLNKILKYLLSVVHEASQATPDSDVAPIARRFYDQILAPSSPWLERQMARLAIRTLPKQAVLMNRIGDQMTSAQLQQAIGETVLSGQTVVQRIEQIITTRNLQGYYA